MCTWQSPAGAPDSTAFLPWWILDTKQAPHLVSTCHMQFPLILTAIPMVPEGTRTLRERSGAPGGGLTPNSMHSGSGTHSLPLKCPINLHFLSWSLTKERNIKSRRYIHGKERWWVTQF